LTYHSSVNSGADTDDLQRLLQEIAHCPTALGIRAGKLSPDHPCQKIVALQTGRPFQAPEPWSGRLDTAPILFISSNPSIDIAEKYPNESWQPNLISDFFQNRFTSSAGWVKDGIYPSLLQGGYRYSWVRYWAAARARAAEIMNKPKRETRPGIDFALTEVVHCKSTNEHGVDDARQHCVSQYLERVLRASQARVFVVYGSFAKLAMQDRFVSLMTDQGDGLKLFSFADRRILICYLPAPNAFAPKSISENIGDFGLSRIREHLNE